MSILLATLVLWIGFIAITKIVDEKDEEWSDLDLFEKVAVTVFIVGDVVYNFTYGTVVFLEFGSLKRKTLTARLKEIVTRQDNEFLDQYWRKPIAMFMCKYMIEPWDFGHCALHRLKK